MSGNSFSAAYVGSCLFCDIDKMVIPDHKVYFVPLETEDEAAYLTAFLNAPVVSKAINAYSSALSLGISVTDYLNIPSFDSSRAEMMELSCMARRFNEGIIPTAEDEERLDVLVTSLIS